MNTTETQVLNALKAATGRADLDNVVTTDTHLFNEGILDSLLTVTFLDHLEAELGKPVDTEILFDPGFVTIGGIAQLVNAQ